MPFSRISTGTDPLRSGKGGPKARLFFLIPMHALAIALGPLLWPSRTAALENPMQSFLGLDYERQIWMPARSGESIPDYPLGFRSDSLAPPRFSAVLGYDYRNLIRKTGGFFYDHGEAVSSLRLSTAVVPHMEFRFSSERSDRDLDFGDTASSVDQSGPTWGWTGSASYLLTPWLTPTVTVGGDSHTGRENALRALALQGVVGSGFAWSASLGEKNLDYPLIVHLKDYKPLSFPLQLRQRFERMSLRFGRGAWMAVWEGDWTQMRYANVAPTGYVLGDSGATWHQTANLAFDHARDGEGLKAMADFQVGFGSHVFRGTTRKDQTQTQFSYQEAEQRSYSLRADLQSLHRAWQWGLYAGAAELEYDALRPDVPAHRHFWDRNGVIDSYQGSLLGVFNTETWLLNGAAYVSNAGGGLWAAKDMLGLHGQVGLGYQRLHLESNSHLTKRETSFILAFREETFETTYPKVTADVLTPELRVSRACGPFSVTVEAAQALPFKVEIIRQGKAKGAVAPKNGDGYSGGTKGRLEIGWRLP